jgi:lipid-A-disaccharide synthase
MKYYLIAGEASGDLHGSNLIKHLREIDPGARFRCFGGDLMRSAGSEVAFHYQNMSFAGIWEIVKNIKTINRTLEFCRQDVMQFGPDALILIDYPGFNLKMAEFARSQGIKTLYYIAPKVWASRKSRLKRIRRSVDKLFVILPFEEAYFTKYGCNAEYNGNPLMDAIASFKPVSGEEFRSANSLSDKPIIALLAGSRKMEISHCLPEMLNACRNFTGYELVLAGAPSISAEYYEPFIRGKNVKLIFGQTYDLLSRAKAAIVVSGTATLETALFGVPEVVIYKLSTPTYIIGRPFLRIPYFSLVNIVMEGEVVKELLQFNLARDIRAETGKLLNDKTYRSKMLTNFEALKKIVGKPGTSKRVAQSMYDFLKK